MAACLLPQRGTNSKQNKVRHCHPQFSLNLIHKTVAEDSVNLLAQLWTRRVLDERLFLRAQYPSIALALLFPQQGIAYRLA